MTKKFTIIGDGAMGTACALLLAKNPDHEVTIWCQFPENQLILETQHENKKFLPGVPIPSTIRSTCEFSQTTDSDGFVVAVPTIYLSATVERLAPHWPAGAPIVSVVKGLEQSTFRAPSKIIADILGDRPICVLCGPSHAEEIARGMPASVVAASGDLRLARQVQQWFSTDRFRVYTSHDQLGVELSAALKNVIAIAAGICDGLDFGDNAKSALMTRGLVEMTRFGVMMGAQAETFMGLAGVGDLITTCISRHGRNRRVGEQLGRGMTLDEILASTQQVAEGVWTARSVHELAQTKNIEMPVTTEVYRILFEKKNPTKAVNDLMAREPKAER